MSLYCLDADVLIQAKNGPYGMDFHPVFWSWLDQQINVGVIISPIMVYNELASGNDELAEWVKARRDSGLFVQATQAAQAVFGQIADHVNANYQHEQAQLFLDGADPWVIAQAKVESAIVVTHEVPVPSTSSRIKIPNVCLQFSVEYVDVYKMLRNLKVQFK